MPFEIFSTINYRAKKLKGAPIEQSFGRFDGAIRRGDDAVNGKRLPAPDFIRINAAADYIEVLKGLRSTIASAEPIIFIERPKGYSPSVDEASLRAVLYPGITLYTLEKESGSQRISLRSFSSDARKIVCLPGFV